MVSLQEVPGAVQSRGLPRANCPGWSLLPTDLR